MSAEQEWQRVCALADLSDDAPRLAVVDGAPVCLVRTGGEVFAIGDTCSHANVSLSEGEVDDHTIECWLHGSRFDLRTGKPTGLPAFRPVPVFAVRVEGEDVLVSTAPDAGA